MTEKDLASKLKNLRQINPDENWLVSNREVLLTQISNSGAANLSAFKILLINFQSTLKALSQPAFALGTFVVVLITGSIFSHQIFAKTKPNDSLYIARVISEKARLNTVFNTEERNKLAVQFATEHAQDITTVLSDPAFNNDSNKDQVAKLNASFNQEINNVKTRMSSLKPKAQEPLKEEEIVSIANSEKDNSGIEISENQDNKNNDTSKSNSLEMEKSTSSLVATSSSSTKIEAISHDSLETDKILDEAQKLFDNKDYGKALDKLREVDEIIK